MLVLNGHGASIALRFAEYGHGGELTGYVSLAAQCRLTCTATTLQQRQL